MAPRRFKMRRLVEDIQRGMEDVALMEKYELTAEELSFVYESLLDGRIPSLEGVIAAVQKRVSPRSYIFFAMPIYDAHNPEIRGVVNDLSEYGLQVAGIDTQVGETRSFVMPHEIFPPDEPLAFEAVCRWIEQDETDWDCIAGMEITKISEKGATQLRELLDEITTGELF
ncbi:MAG: PilZ domain-containing protein [Thermodesulfobacteriota bacterium]